jgi:hypothetical protein
MAEVYPSDNSLLNLISEAETGIEYIETGKAPYYLEFRKLLYRLGLATRRANDLRVFDEGGLDIGVKAGKFWFGSTLVEYAGSSSNTLADDKASIYVYLDRAGNLVVDEYTAFPDENTFHLRLAVVTAAGGDITSITDMRGSELWNFPVTGGNCADAGALGAVTFMLKATITDGQDVNIYDADAPFKFRVLDAWSVAKSADGGSWKLTDGTNDISDTVTVTGTDKTIDRAGTIDDDYHEIAANGTLTVDADGVNADAEVYVLCMRVA